MFKNEFDRGNSFKREVATPALLSYGLLAGMPLRHSSQRQMKTAHDPRRLNTARVVLLPLLPWPWHSSWLQGQPLQSRQLHDWLPSGLLDLIEVQKGLDDPVIRSTCPGLAFGPGPPGSKP
jgi:hypothetical protein